MPHVLHIRTGSESLTYPGNPGFPLLAGELDALLERLAWFWVDRQGEVGALRALQEQRVAPGRNFKGSRRAPDVISVEVDVGHEVRGHAHARIERHAALEKLVGLDVDLLYVRLEVRVLELERVRTGGELDRIGHRRRV